MSKSTYEKFKEIVGEKLADVKQLFDMPMAEAAPKAEAEYTDVKTADGVVLRIEKMEQGAKCTVIGETGETPAEGEYTLEDGKVLVIKAGIIESVNEPKDAASVTPEEMAETNELKEQVKSITYKYSEIEKSIEESKKAIEGLKKDNEKLSAQNKAMFSIIENLASLPAEEPTQEPKDKTKSGRLAEFRSEIKEMRKARKENRD